MKIEPFPWLRDYLVDMNKLYTELTLEKIKNTILGEKFKHIENYEQIFQCDSDSDSDWEAEEECSADEGSLILGREPVKSTLGRKRILLNADPGMGKTTLGKKIGFDRARGILKQFSVIFFIALKLVKPGEAIENIIIQQHPELEGLHVSPEKVSAMFEKFGNMCVLFLDGLDEHDLGQNEDVMKMIGNQKLLDCGIVVSCRPHSVIEVEQHFATVIRVDGFTETEATKFVSNFFTDSRKITQILQFKLSGSREDFPVHKCPILLSFLCLLVKEEEIDLSDTRLTVGDLYLRMVKCLYKKFTIRKGIQFKECAFVKVIKSVARLALQTLLSNNPLVQRSKVTDIVGNLAFDYGFFTGHENFRPSSDPTADTCVTYAHRSLEEFFGLFGFLQALDDGKSIDDILGSDCKKPIFMVNPLVLKFCLWIMAKEYFESSKQIYDTLTSYVAKRIDRYILDTEIVGQLFPAINSGNLWPDDKELLVKFFKEVFQKCADIRILHIPAIDSYCNDEPTARNQVNTMLERLSPNILDKLTVLTIIDGVGCDVNIDLRSEFNIVIKTGRKRDPLEISNLLLTKYNLLKRNPHVYITWTMSQSHEDLMPMMTNQIKEFRLYAEYSKCTLFASAGVPFCPHFTHFIASGFRIDPPVPSAFMNAVKVGNLPNLRRIELRSCTLSNCEWPEVLEFSLWR